MSTKVKKFKLGEDFENVEVFTNWKASFDGTTLKLEYNDGHITNHKEFTCRRGDYVGVSPTIDGTFINIFKMRSPKDPRTKILWRLGYTSPKRIKGISNPDVFSIKEYMDDYPERKYTDSVEIKDHNGITMVASFREVIDDDGHMYDWWFMHPNATIDHVKEWEQQYLSMKK